MIGSAINISKQLHGWLDSLKNTDIKGVKFFTDKEKKRFEQDKEFEEFDRTMERFRQELLEKLTPQSLKADGSE